jgi:hypothetical protein
MKFVVRKDYGDEVDVKLHWESKAKIKKVLLWAGTVAATVGGVLYFYKNPTIIETDPDTE